MKFAKAFASVSVFLFCVNPAAGQDGASSVPATDLKLEERSEEFGLSTGETKLFKLDMEPSQGNTTTIRCATNDRDGSLHLYVREDVPDADPSCVSSLEGGSQECVVDLAPNTTELWVSVENVDMLYNYSDGYRLFCEDDPTPGGPAPIELALGIPSAPFDIMMFDGNVQELFVDVPPNEIQALSCSIEAPSGGFHLFMQIADERDERFDLNKTDCMAMNNQVVEGCAVNMNADSIARVFVTVANTGVPTRDIVVTCNPARPTPVKLTLGVTSDPFDMNSLHSVPFEFHVPPGVESVACQMSENAQHFYITMTQGEDISYGDLSCVTTAWSICELPTKSVTHFSVLLMAHGPAPTKKNISFTCVDMTDPPTVAVSRGNPDHN